MKNIRKFFPIFSQQKKLVYLDSAGTSFKPFSVIRAIQDYYQSYSINTHSEGSNFLTQKVQAAVQQTRQLIAEKINGAAEEIIFLPSATYALNILALSLKKFCRWGNKILLTTLEHSSNCYPWQEVAREKATKVEFLPLNEEFVVDINKLENYIDKKTTIVSFSHLSNSLGVINPVAEISQKIKRINPGCLVIVDACQSVAHLPINVKEWNIDALVFSGHKIYGPTGIGILWIKKELGEKLPHLLWGGGKKISPCSSPEEQKNFPLFSKFEVGTLPLAQILGLKKSVEFLNSLDQKEVFAYEKNLRDYACQKLNKIKEIIIYNQNLATDIILFNLGKFHAHDVADYLGRNNILVRAGNFCCPYLKELIRVEAAIRVSLFPYNNKKDVNKLVSSLKKIIDNPELLVPFL